MKQQHILLNGRVRTIKPDANVQDAVQKLRDKGYEVDLINKPPTLKTLEKYSENGIARATDGCKCEPDGTCCHGKKSWLLVMGMI
jgi:hypothetical protein